METIQAIEQQEAHQEQEPSMLIKGWGMNDYHYKQEPSQEQKIKLIVEQLNILQAQDLKENDYINECFFNDNGELQDSEKYNLKEKTKYFYIDKDTTGVFMVEKATGEIYRIKAYSQVYKNKCCGNIATIKSEELFKLRWW